MQESSRTGTTKANLEIDRLKFPFGNMTIASATELGEAVREARRAQNLRQGELALVAGTGRRFIVELERGKPTAQLAQVLRVVQALGLNVELQQGAGGGEGWTRLS